MPGQRPSSDLSLARRVAMCSSQERYGTTARPTLSVSAQSARAITQRKGACMHTNPAPDTHCSVKEFLRLSSMSRSTFFTKYRYDPAYAALLDVKTDRMHCVWLSRQAAAVIRAERVHKESHGNRGKAPVRRCTSCKYDGHPRHTFCHACGKAFPAVA